MSETNEEKPKSDGIKEWVKKGGGCLGLNVMLCCAHCYEMTMIPVREEYVNNVVPRDLDDAYGRLVSRGTGWSYGWRRAFCPNCNEARDAWYEAKRAAYAERVARYNAAMKEGQAKWPKQKSVLGWYISCDTDVWEITVRTKAALKKLPTEFAGFPVTARVAALKETPYIAVTG